MASTGGDSVIYYCILLFIFAVLLHIFIKKYTNTSSRAITKYPPCPPGLPIIGHLHLMGSPLHKSLHSLANRYGPLIQIRMGASSAILVSDSKFAKEIYKTHELNFVSRPEFGSSEYNIYKESGFFTAPYGTYWKFLKKLCMTQLLSSSTLNQFVHVREEEVMKLLESLTKISAKGESCELSMSLLTLTNNVICRMAMSTRCSGSANEAKKVKELVDRIVVIGGKLSLGDVFGPLGKFDLFGYGRKLRKTLEKFDQLMEQIIRDKEKSGCEKETRDLMDILLECCKDQDEQVKLTRTDIKGFFLDMFIAGTETSSTALQWAMAELIKHPQAFKKLREEILSAVGSGRLVKESDIPNLPYLQAVVKETLRLHPPSILALRECKEECNINGFVLTGKSRMMINLYTIMHDPNSWVDSDEFIPDRFMVNHVVNPNQHQMEMKGLNFDYLPFGSGRRACPGASLALLVLHSTIGALVQCFDWKVKDGEKVDMREGLAGFSVILENPLVCYPVIHFNPFIEH